MNNFKGKGNKSSGYNLGGGNVNFTTLAKSDSRQKFTTANRNWPSKLAGEEVEWLTKGPLQCWTCGENHMRRDSPKWKQSGTKCTM